MSQTIKYKIRRYNKEKGSFIQEYEVSLEKWATVLEGLIKIRNEIDPTLSFRMSCKSGICGSCSMRINGRARLACKTKTEDMRKEYGEIFIEPLGNLNVLKDLVVDMTPFYDEMKSIEPWLQAENHNNANERHVSPDENEVIEKTGECLWCGACFSDCPSREANKEYLGPAAAVLSHRFIFDVRDSEKLKRLKKVVDKNIWLCAHCEKATENCPQKINPQDVISKLREESIKEGMTDNLGARHALAVDKSIKLTGEISETWLPIWTFGKFGVIKEWKTALKLLSKRKFPPIKLKKIQDYEDILVLYREIYKDAQKKGKKSIKKRRKMKP